MARRRMKVEERLREELSRGCEYSGTQENVQESFEEMAEQIGMEGDWDEIEVKDCDGNEFVLQGCHRAVLRHNDRKSPELYRRGMRNST